MITDLELKKYGIDHVQDVIYNPSYEFLFEQELSNDQQGYGQGLLSSQGAVSVHTGIYTGRSPKDKYLVYDEQTKDTVWWHSPESPNDNKPITESVWKDLKQLVINQLSGKTLYVIDAFCGANANTRLKVRFFVEVPWQAHFVKNMFIRPTQVELDNFGEPDFVVMNASKTKNTNWQKHGLNSDIFTVFNLTEKMQIIGGTWYGGEMKKGMFSVMNYYLPRKNIASMHCAANKGRDGDVALFFGLSGTGKTTLSTDPKRQLIGDDEHGWDDDGVFNLEGGCYAKTIHLKQESEPDIYGAIKRDALLENVVLKSNGDVDYDDASITENTRVSYPLYHIKNRVQPISRAGHATKVIFLTADSFGVLPVVSKLTLEQAQYYFLSGYTAKLAGTERGVTTAVPTFSACFGKAFLSLHPQQYADVLVRRMTAVNAQAYLVNTGWNGQGERISIEATRLVIDRILDGSVQNSQTRVLPIFNLAMPTELDGLTDDLLDPRASHVTTDTWYTRANDLASQFVTNFQLFYGCPDSANLIAAGPQLTGKYSNENLGNLKVS